MLREFEQNLKNPQKNCPENLVLLQKVENLHNENYLFKSVDIFSAKVYNYAYRMNKLTKRGRVPAKSFLLI